MTCATEDLGKYLKSVDFVSEAQEFRKASLDGRVSFPVGCFYRSYKGGSDKVKMYNGQTEDGAATSGRSLAPGFGLNIP